jgi:hypothetical protein
MIPISNIKLESVIEKYKESIDEHIENVNSILIKILKDKERKYKINSNTYYFDKSEYLYIRYLRSKLKKIVYSDLDYLNQIGKIFDLFRLNIEKIKKFKPLKDLLIQKLGYNQLRSDEEKALYPQFYKDLGIKTCVYCNSQLTISAEKTDKKLSAKFQVDHFLDKAKFPCFSISFYNLYPVCASCNNAKGKNPIKFYLYASDIYSTYISDFYFYIDKGSITKFRLNKDESLLKIFFEDKKSGLNEFLAINGIYETQKDIAAEIIIKSEIYNDTYKESLHQSFKKIYGSKNSILNFNRIILGNYTESNEIHNRPFSKFTQDIARQLKLID